MKTRVILTSLTAVALAACSDSDSITSQPPSSADISDIAVAGRITAFGSVVANGVHFGTDSATVVMNGEPGTLADLRVGMIVAIEGTIDNVTGEAVATQISFLDDVEGPIASMNKARSTFIVLGRTIIVDELTVFEDATFDDLASGNVVQVSGQRRNEERIQATYIRRTANSYQVGMRMEVKGAISDLDIGTNRFRIGSQVCDYSGAALDLGGADLANGLYVEASSDSPMSNGVMLLDQVQVRDQNRDRDQLCDSECTFEIEGFITSFTSISEFEVDGQPVTTDENTIYVNGTADTLAMDIRVAVDGTLDANDMLLADRIVFRLPSEIEVQADVEAIAIESGEVTLLGIVVETNEATLFQDQSTYNIRDFGLDDLAASERIGIRAYVDGDSLIASRLVRYDAGAEVILKAPVETIARPSVTMLGVMATSNEATIFQNEEKQIITADEFFEAVEISSLVRAMGTYDGASILASKMFLRECQNTSCL
jgi:hypothetical protein